MIFPDGCNANNIVYHFRVPPQTAEKLKTFPIPFHSLSVMLARKYTLK
jgi:hypothetical protein